MGHHESEAEYQRYLQIGDEVDDYEYSRCSTPGPNGCGECDDCLEWADRENDMQADLQREGYY